MVFERDPHSSWQHRLDLCGGGMAGSSQRKRVKLRNRIPLCGHHDVVVRRTRSTARGLPRAKHFSLRDVYGGGDVGHVCAFIGQITIPGTGFSLLENLRAFSLTPAWFGFEADPHPSWQHRLDLCGGGMAGGSQRKRVKLRNRIPRCGHRDVVVRRGVDRVGAEVRLRWPPVPPGRRPKRASPAARMRRP